MSYLLPSPQVDTHSFVSQFVHNDTQELFKSNLNRYGSNWYWAKNVIVYRFNKLGYRMDKELDDVDFSNYYAFFGCSFTVGTGLPIEDTFVYKIAKQSKVDYVNAGLAGASVELVFNNIVSLLNNAPMKPKVIVINWPELYRTMYWEKDNIVFMSPSIDPRSITKHWFRSYGEFITEDTNVMNRFKLIRDTVKLLCNNMDIKLVELSSFQGLENFKQLFRDIKTIPIGSIKNETVENMHLNRARDVSITNPISSHPGLIHQELIVNEFFKAIL